MKATVILLPLLGITWVFGLLAVNQESSVFAWIFTILNSLQVIISLLYICNFFAFCISSVGTVYVIQNLICKSHPTGDVYFHIPCDQK